MNSNKIMIVGAGVMGLGIAQIALRNDFIVFLQDINRQILETGLKKIEKNLDQSIIKGKLTLKEKESCLAKIRLTESLEQVKEMDFIIEAVFEDIEVKKKVLNDLDLYLNAKTILASNTTSLSITELSTVLRRPQNFIGMHFFNPVWAMQLVEITPGFSTSPHTIKFTKEIAEKMGKTPIIVKEAPGGIVSRILGSLLNEAIFVYAEGIASAEDIDTAMKLGANLPIGPLHLLDLIGLDVHLAKMETLYREFSDSKYRPHPLLRKMVRGGLLGKKTGKGFFDYQVKEN